MNSHKQSSTVSGIPVSIELDTDGLYVVADEIFHIYGVGATQAAAIKDYEVSLTDYHGLLTNMSIYNPTARPLLEKLTHLMNSPEVDLHSKSKR